MADLRISALPPLSGALLQASDPLAVADLSASETKQITAKDLVQAAMSFIDDGSIPGTKVTAALLPGSVGTAELADDAVTALKLGNNSSGVVGNGLPAAGAFIGQLAVDETAGRVYIWNGASWGSYTSSATVNVIQGGSAGALTTSVTTVGDTAQVVTAVNDSTGPAQFLGGPSVSGGPVTLRALIWSDLPLATNSTPGAVAVPGGSGLRIDGGASGLEANIEIDNTITASPTEYHVVRYDTHGLVTAGRLLESSDLPLATLGGPGAIATGLEFAVTPAGVLQHRNQVTGATGAKITYDDQGHVTGSAALDAADIPTLPASKISGGTFDPGLYAFRSIEQSALADYTVAYIQEAEPVASPNEAHRGMFWFQESTGALRMWNGNSWFPVGFGRLAQDNLRWGGLFDASTGLVTGVTNFGIQAGLAVGGPIPAATDQLSGLYVVAEVAGNNVAVTPGITYDAGDWLLCVNQTNGWTRIDTLSGGGGGGATYLNDLLDVALNAPQTSQVLMFNAGTGQWTNQSLPASGVSSVFGRSGAVVAVEGDYSLNLLGDVTLTSPATGNLLQFNGTQWVNVSLNTVGGVTSVYGRTGAVVAAEGDYDLDQLGDVDLTTNAPVSGDLLTYNGSDWVPVAASSVGGVTSAFGRTGDVVAAEGDYDLDQLGDVVLTTPVNGEVLTFNGTAWVNSAITPSGVVSVTAGNGLADSGTASAPVLDVGAGVGIAVAANDVSIDRATVDTWYAPLANPTFTDAFYVNGSYRGNIASVAALDIDCSAGNYFTKTINGESTFTVSNVPASRSYSFVLELEHTSGAITWFSGVEWPSGTAPTLTTGKTHFFIFHTDNGGTRWRASSLINYTT